MAASALPTSSVVRSSHSIVSYSRRSRKLRIACELVPLGRADAPREELAGAGRRSRREGHDVVLLVDRLDLHAHAEGRANPRAGLATRGYARRAEVDLHRLRCRARRHDLERERLAVPQLHPVARDDLVEVRHRRVHLDVHERTVLASDCDDARVARDGDDLRCGRDVVGDLHLAAGVRVGGTGRRRRLRARALAGADEREARDGHGCGKRADRERGLHVEVLLVMGIDHPRAKRARGE